VFDERELNCCQGLGHLSTPHGADFPLMLYPDVHLKLIDNVLVTLLVLGGTFML
jgi:hypothetical protein